MNDAEKQIFAVVFALRYDRERLNDVSVTQEEATKAAFTEAARAIASLRVILASPELARTIDDLEGI